VVATPVTLRGELTHPVAQRLKIRHAASIARLVGLLA
jgi:hypothetical protein